MINAEDNNAEHCRMARKIIIFILPMIYTQYSNIHRIQSRTINTCLTLLVSNGTCGAVGGMGFTSRHTPKVARRIRQYLAWSLRYTILRVYTVLSLHLLAWYY